MIYIEVYSEDNKMFNTYAMCRGYNTVLDRLKTTLLHRKNATIKEPEVNKHGNNIIKKITFGVFGKHNVANCVTSLITTNDPNFIINPILRRRLYS